MAKGKIKTLYSDRKETEVLFPRTKIGAVSDNNGVGLDAILQTTVHVGELAEADSVAPRDADTLGGILAKDYATQTYVKEQVLKVQTGGEVDLGQYATKEDLENLEFPVNSVNGQTGEINLSASDVGARPNTWLPSITEIGAAPSGFGYGEAMTPINGDDSALEQMLSSMKIDEAKQFCFSGGDTTFSGRGWFYGTVYKTDSSYATVVAFNYSNNATVRRTKLAGIWQPWEWVNPPFDMGNTEYRTIERYFGKPVYAKAVDMGSLPSASSKSVAHGISNVKYVVSITGQAWQSDGTKFTIPFIRDPTAPTSSMVSLHANQNHVILNQVGSVYGSSYSVYAIIKYTKTTD